MYNAYLVKASTHLMFQGDANAALALYDSVFTDFQIESVEHEAVKGGDGQTVQIARVSFAGHDLIVLDSPIPHDFTFTPSMSLFVDFEGTKDMTSAFQALSEDGEIMMPPDNYGFSQHFAWVKDRFGVSWQLNVPSTTDQ